VIVDAVTGDHCIGDAGDLRDFRWDRKSGIFEPLPGAENFVDPPVLSVILEGFSSDSAAFTNPEGAKWPQLRSVFDSEVKPKAATLGSFETELRLFWSYGWRAELRGKSLFRIIVYNNLILVELVEYHFYCCLARLDHTSYSSTILQLLRFRDGNDKIVLLLHLESRIRQGE
jgi:hypothetical protein